MEFNIQNYKELKGKTIFDFTKDEVIIVEIVGFNPSDEATKEHYVKNCHPINAAHDIYEYACMIKEKGLRQAALLYSDEAQEEFEKRAEEAAKEGIIID